MKVGEATAWELMSYLDGEVNNRALTVDVDGEEWDMESAVFRTSDPNAGNLEMLLTKGKSRRGVSLALTVTDDVRVPDAP